MRDSTVATIALAVIAVCAIFKPPSIEAKDISLLAIGTMGGFVTGHVVGRLSRKGGDTSGERAGTGGSPTSASTPPAPEPPSSPALPSADGG
jgi:hypothetical protein